MKSDDTTKEQLLKEIALLKAKITGLEKSEIDHKQTEEALQESEERFRAQYNGSPTPSFTWRAIGEDFVLVDYNNEAIATINGQSYKYLGKTAKEMYKNRHEIIYDLHRCLTEKTIIKNELMSEHFMPGKYIITTYAFVPPDLVMVHITDITELKRAEEQLKKSLKEKEVMIKEIYHRVKNNLAVVSGLLNIQAANIKDKKAKAAFQATRDRIFSLSAVHSQLYHSENYSYVDYKEYIKKLVNNIFYSSQISGQVKLHLDLAAITLPIDKAIPCGLLVNELVTNALKHAFPEKRKGNLWITTHSLEDKNCEIIVKDDGIGIPESFNIEKTETLGLKLIELLTKQIEGTLEIESKKGTEFRIRLSTESRQVIR